jgi:NAD(P)-dependent dehydrogenase (short-subunit alcohol dehydrogenase family)
MGTNCLGPFLFTKCLLPVLRKTAASSPSGAVRVTWAGSISIDISAPDSGMLFELNGAPKTHGNQLTNYGQSKAGNYFLSCELARRSRQDGIISVVGSQISARD